jgi:hypothetical protein
MTNTRPPAPAPAPAPVPQEGRSEFLARARALSGLDEIDFRHMIDRAYVLAPGDVLPGAIVARRGPVYLCTVGYPDGERDDGSPFWDPRPENWAFCVIPCKQPPTFG